VVDLDEARGRKVAADFETKYYRTVAECLKDPEVEAAVVCLSHDQHYPVAMEVMRAGRHVLVEKPLATSVRDADDMIAYSREQHLVLMAAMSRRHFFAFHEIKRRMKTDIGEPLNLLYTFACFFDENVAPPWWRSEEKTGGLSFSMLGSHSVDFTLWMCEGKKPVRVYAEGHDVNPHLQGYDEVSILLKFDDGSTATNFLSINTRPSRHEGLIVGSKGSAYFSHAGDHVGLIGTASADLYINGKLVMQGEQEPHIFAVQMKEFLGAIKEKREPWVSLDQVRLQLRVIEAARESVRRAAPVDLR
jgi:predicted dehydrogenase